jgi:rhodanese-related sulfurtransferase
MKATAVKVPSHRFVARLSLPSTLRPRGDAVGRPVDIVSLVSAMVCLFSLLPTSALAAEFQTPAITADALIARQGTADGMLIIDVRPLGEYKSGHVAGAINIPYTEMEKHLDELSRAKNGSVLYCTFGKRTRLAERTLLEHHVPNVFHLEGGLRAWLEGGYEVHTGWGP